METIDFDINRTIEQYHDVCRTIPLKPIHSEVEYQNAITVLNKLLDAGGADEKHPLAELVDAIGVFIQTYENQDCPK
jgi:HTH-type transcriptional regulator/antitoxin HigA